MSWSDPCGNCGQHRADCDCGNWNNRNDKTNLMEQYKEVQVVMLPTEWSPLCITGSILSLHNNKFQRNKWDSPQHLYFTSNDEIKYDEYYLSDNTFYCRSIGLNGTNPKRIEATTNKELELPSIPESFLQRYTACNGKIEKVKLKTCCLYGDNCPSMGAFDKQDLCNVGLELTDKNEVIVLDEPAVGYGVQELAQNAVTFLEKEFAKIDNQILPPVLTAVQYTGTPVQKEAIPYGRYLVMRKDGEMHLETFNGTGWAYNNNSITWFYMPAIG